MKQIPLPLRLATNTTFGNYVAGNNATTIHFLAQLVQGNEELQTLLWCKHQYGKSHLLQAACHAAVAAGKNPAYIPLKSFYEFEPELLQGLDQLDLVCIDDIHLVVEDAHWENQLFQLINRCRESGARLVISSCVHPSELNVDLEDLRSRLLWGPVFHLKKLTDGELLSAIMSRATEKGILLPHDVAAYLLKHCPRNISELYRVIDKLDEESLIQKRRVTLPLVRTVLQ